MNLSVFLLLVHVCGAVAFAAGPFISLFGWLSLRRVERVEQVRLVLRLMVMPGPVAGFGMLFIIVSGLYMVATTWGWQTGWIDVSLGSLIVLLMPSGAFIGIRRQAIARLSNEIPDGPLSEELVKRIQDPLLGTSTIMLNALLFGIIFLMVVKPAPIFSLIVIGASIVLGLAFSLPIWRVKSDERKTVEYT